MYGGSGTWPWRSMSAVGSISSASRRTSRVAVGRPSGGPLALAVGRLVFDARAEAGRDVHDRARPQPASRPQHRLPQLGAARADQQQLGRAPARPGPQQSRGEDAAAVQDDEVVGPEQLGQLVEAVMREPAARALEHEQPRRVALGERLLRDQLGRQLVVVRADRVVRVERRPRLRVPAVRTASSAALPARRRWEPEVLVGARGRGASARRAVEEARAAAGRARRCPRSPPAPR